MNEDELLESLDRHFLSGCADLDSSQMAQHRARGSCRDCDGGARGARERTDRIDRIMDEELPRYAEALKRLGE